MFLLGFIIIASVYSVFCFVLFLSDVDKSGGMIDDTRMSEPYNYVFLVVVVVVFIYNSFYKGTTDGKISSKICVRCLCMYVLFYICVWIVFVDCLRKGFAQKKSVRMRMGAKSDCPGGNPLRLTRR